MSVKLIATGVDGQHIAPSDAAHPAVSGLAASASIQDELDAMVEDLRNIVWELPDEVMRLCQAYMARCTEFYLQLVRETSRASKYVRTQELSRVIDLIDFTYKAASRSVEIRRQDVEMSK